VDDIKLPADALHAALVTSARPHARLLKVDPSAALAVPGVEAYYDHTCGGGGRAGCLPACLPACLLCLLLRSAAALLLLSLSATPHLTSPSRLSILQPRAGRQHHRPRVPRRAAVCCGAGHVRGPGDRRGGGHQRGGGARGRQEGAGGRPGRGLGPRWAWSALLASGDVGLRGCTRVWPAGRPGAGCTALQCRRAGSRRSSRRREGLPAGRCACLGRRLPLTAGPDTAGARRSSTRTCPPPSPSPRPWRRSPSTTRTRRAAGTWTPPLAAASARCGAAAGWGLGAGGCRWRGRGLLLAPGAGHVAACTRGRRCGSCLGGQLALQRPGKRTS
jgi:hypothetical protein